MKFTKSDQQKVLNQLNASSSKKRHRKFLLSGLTIATVLLLLVAGSFFIPNIDNVVAKIPYINKFIKEEEIQREDEKQVHNFVGNLLEENGLKVGYWSFSREEREMIVEIIDLNEVDNDILEEIEQQLKDEQLNGYEVMLVPYEPPEDMLTERSEGEIEQDILTSNELISVLTERIESEGYELMFPIQVGIDQKDVIDITVIVPKSEYRLEKLKEIMKEEASNYGNEFKFDVRQVQKKAREQEKRWEKTDAISNIGIALEASDQFPVTGFAYSFHPYPVQIIIKTSLDPNDSEALQIANEIRSEIDSYIESSEETATIRDDQYKVIVRDENGEAID